MKWGSALKFFYEKTIIGNLTKISGNKYLNWRFYLNSVTEFEYYQNTFNLVHTYLASELFNLTVSPANSSLVFNREVLIDCKFYKLLFFI